MNKRVFSLAVGIFFVLLISGFITAAETNYTTSNNDNGVQISMLKYEPDVVNPGEYFDVWIHASLGSDINYAKFTLMDSFPFSIDGSDDPVREYTNVPSRDVVMHYKVRVSKDAVEGDNELKLGVVTNKGSNSTNVETFDIYVQDVQTDFDLVMQDSSTSEASLAIANVGKNTANSMIVRIPTQSSYRVTGTNGQMVGNLDSGDYTIVSFAIAKVSRNNDPLLVEIDYTDSIGERRNVTKEIDFTSGTTVGNFSQSAAAGNFSQGSFARGNFSRQQTTTAKWPYELAAVIIIGGVVFFFYQRDPRKFKQFFKKNKNESEKKKEKLNLPDWMIKEREKSKR